MKNVICVGVTCAMLVLSPITHSALYVHSAPKPPAQEVIQNSTLPEQASIRGRARDQRLEDALSSIVRNKMQVEFVSPELKSMKVNWRSTGEPVQIVLTNIARGYGVDISLNEVQETVFVAVDTGKCDPLRESTLLKRAKMWASLGINDMPTLPPRLPLPIDYTGHAYRLC